MNTYNYYAGTLLEMEWVMLITLFPIYKKPEILVKFLVNLLCLYIQLRMLYSQGYYFNTKHTIKYFSKESDKLRSIVRDNTSREVIQQCKQKEVDSLDNRYELLK